MAQIFAKQIIRQGDLADLPILSAGELGYANDVKKLYIGNDTTKHPLWTQTPTNGQTEVNFGVDLEDAAGESYRIRVNYTDRSFTVDGFVVTFDAPLADTDIVTLELNSEVLMNTSDRASDLIPLSHEISNAGHINSPIAGITYHQEDMNTITLNYSITDVSDDTRFRQGVIRVMVHGDIFTIDDNYTTSNLDADWDHTFNGSVTSGLFVLDVTTTCANNSIFNWVSTTFKNT